VRFLSAFRSCHGNLGTHPNFFVLITGKQVKKQKRSPPFPRFIQKAKASPKSSLLQFQCCSAGPVQAVRPHEQPAGLSVLLPRRTRRQGQGKARATQPKSDASNRPSPRAAGLGEGLAGPSGSGRCCPPLPGKKKRRKTEAGFGSQLSRTRNYKSWFLT